MSLEAYMEKHTPLFAVNGAIPDYVKTGLKDFYERYLSPEAVKRESQEFESLNSQQVKNKIAKIKQQTRLNRFKFDGCFSSQERRSLRKVAWGSGDPRIKKVYEKAAEWGMAVDHVIPLQGKTVSGLHVWENLQLMNRRENSSKGNRFVPE